MFTRRSLMANGGRLVAAFLFAPQLALKASANTATINPGTVDGIPPPSGAAKPPTIVVTGHYRVPTYEATVVRADADGVWFVVPEVEDSEMMYPYRGHEGDLRFNPKTNTYTLHRKA